MPSLSGEAKLFYCSSRLCKYVKQQYSAESIHSPTADSMDRVSPYLRLPSLACPLNGIEAIKAKTSLLTLSRARGSGYGPFAKVCRCFISLLS